MDGNPFHSQFEFLQSGESSSRPSLWKGWFGQTATYGSGTLKFYENGQSDAYVYAYGDLTQSFQATSCCTCSDCGNSNDAMNVNYYGKSFVYWKPDRLISHDRATFVNPSYGRFQIWFPATADPSVTSNALTALNVDQNLFVTPLFPTSITTSLYATNPNIMSLTVTPSPTGSTTYAYVIVPTGPLMGLSSTSKTISGTDPGGPSSLGGGNQISLSWTQSTRAGCTGYLAYRMAGGTTTGLISTISSCSTTTLVDNGLTGDGTIPFAQAYDGSENRLEYMGIPAAQGTGQLFYRYAADASSSGTSYYAIDVIEGKNSGGSATPTAALTGTGMNCAQVKASANDLVTCFTSSAGGSTISLPASVSYTRNASQAKWLITDLAASTNVLYQAGSTTKICASGDTVNCPSGIAATTSSNGTLFFTDP